MPAAGTAGGVASTCLIDPVTEAQERILVHIPGTRQAPVGHPICKARTGQGPQPLLALSLATHAECQRMWSQEETSGGWAPGGEGTRGRWLGQEGSWGYISDLQLQRQTQPLPHRWQTSPIPGCFSVPQQTSLINGLPPGWGPEAGPRFPHLGTRKPLRTCKGSTDSELMCGIKSPQTIEKSALPASDLEQLVLN